MAGVISHLRGTGVKQREFMYPGRLTGGSVEECRVKNPTKVFNLKIVQKIKQVHV